MQLYTLNKEIELFEVLADNEEQKIVHLHLLADKEIKRHKSDYLVTVIVVAGEVAFSNDEKTEILNQNTILTLERGEFHALKALKNSEIIVYQQKK